MSSPNQIVERYRTQLVTLEARIAQSIRNAHRRALSAIQPHIDALLKAFKNALSGGNPLTLAWLYIGDKLAKLKRLVAQIINAFADQAKSLVVQVQQASVALGGQSAQAQLGTVAPAQQIKPAPTASAQKIVGSTRQGKPISTIMSGFGDEASDKVGKALIAGVSIGQHPDVISRAIATALLVSLSRALTIERTSAADAYRSSTLVTLQENEDAVSGWLWALGGPNPCSFCLSMAGTKHSLDEDMETHPNCMCVMQLIAKGA